MQSSLLYTMNQGNVLLEQSLIMGMLFNLAKFSAPAFIFIVGFHLIRHYTKQLVYKEYISEKRYTYSFRISFGLFFTY